MKTVRLITETKEPGCVWVNLGPENTSISCDVPLKRNFHIEMYLENVGWNSRLVYRSIIRISSLKSRNGLEYKNWFKRFWILLWFCLLILLSLSPYFWFQFSLCRYGDKSPYCRAQKNGLGKGLWPKQGQLNPSIAFSVLSWWEEAPYLCWLQTLRISI